MQYVACKQNGEIIECPDGAEASPIDWAELNTQGEYRVFTELEAATAYAINGTHNGEPSPKNAMTK